MNLRDQMPITAAFIDAMREAFGADVINAQIRAGLRGEPGFWARENGYEVGVKLPAGVSFEHDGDRWVRVWN
jgi:hypothetical protein